MAKTESPEQKLQNMIKAASSKKASTTPQANSAAQLLAAAAAKKGPVAAAKLKKDSAFSKLDVLAFIKVLNKVLMVLVLIAIVVLVNEFMSGGKLLRQRIRFSVKGTPIEASSQSEVSTPKWQRLSYYLSKVKDRNIFKPSEKESTSRPVADISMDEDSRLIAHKVKNLRLVGIAWLDRVDTAAVMIEDLDKKKTYFLNKGEKIGDIKIKTIYADSALLSYQNEEIMISYDKAQM